MTRVLALRPGLDPFAAARLRADAEALEQEAPDTVRFTCATKMRSRWRIGPN